MASYGNPKSGTDRNVDRNANVNEDRSRDTEEVRGRPGEPQDEARRREAEQQGGSAERGEPDAQREQREQREQDDQRR